MKNNKIDNVFFLLTVLCIGGVPLLILPQFFPTFLAEKEGLFRLCLSLMMPLAVFNILNNREKRNYFNMITLSAGLYIISIIISKIFSQYNKIGYNLVFEYATYLLFYFLILISYRKEYLLDTLRILSITAFFCGFYAILQHYGIDISGIRWDNESLIASRGVGTIGNPTYLGVYLAAILPINLFLYFTGNETQTIPKYKISWWRKRNIYLIIWLINSIALYFTYSRGAWVAFLVSHIAFFIILGRKQILEYRKPAIIALLSISLIFLLCLLYEKIGNSRFTLVNRIASVGEQSAKGFAGRLYLWKTALKVFQNNIITGSGPGSFSYIYLKYRKDEPEALRSTNWFMGTCHNDFIDCVSSYGIIGLISYLLFIFFIIRYLIKLIMNSDDFEKLKWIAVLSSIIGYLTAVFFLFPTISTQVIFWFYAAVVSIEFTNSETPEKRRKKEKTDGKRKYNKYSYLLYGTAAVISVIILVINIRLLAGSYYVSMAMEQQQKKNWTLSSCFFDKARAFDPWNYSYNLFNGKMLETAMKESGPDQSTFNKIIALYKKGSNMNPYDHCAFAQMGRVYQYSGRENKDFYIESKNYFEQAIKLDPYNYTYYDELGVVCAEMGNTPEALWNFSRSIELYSLYPSAHYNLAVLLYRQKDFDKALIHIREALLINPTYEKAKDLEREILRGLRK